MSTPQRIANVALGVSWPSVFVSWAATTLPLVQWIAAGLAAVASGYAIAVWRKKLAAK